MIYPKGTKILILGLGNYHQGTGVSSAEYFAKLGYRIIVSDVKQADDLKDNIKKLKKYKNIIFHLAGDVSVKDAEWADFVVKNPAIRKDNEVLKKAIKLGKLIENDITVFLKQVPCLTVGVTGTRGKSTTTAWIGDMLRRSGKKVYIGGNITVSPLTFLNKIKKQDVAVLELSSWLLEVCGFNGLSPNIAVWTNLLPDHLNTYDGMDDYAEAKAQIMRNQSFKDIFIPNLDDEFVKRYVTESAARVKGFSDKKFKQSVAFIKKDRIVFFESKKEQDILKIKDLGLKGSHNIKNALAAMVGARFAGASFGGIKESLKKFGGVPYRQEVVGLKNGITFINDTTSTTPDASIAALQTFYKLNKNLHWICGGTDKNLSFTAMAEFAKKIKPKIYILNGTASGKLMKAFKSVKLETQEFDSLKNAFKYALINAKKGDTILLSPACASFGMFKNEFDRGDQFNALVKGKI